MPRPRCCVGAGVAAEIAPAAGAAPAADAGRVAGARLDDDVRDVVDLLKPIMVCVRMEQSLRTDFLTGSR